MKCVRLIALSVVAIYFLLAFNAYACLIPLYGNVQMDKGSGCAMPKEQPARDACDTFKAIGVQSLSSPNPLSDCHLQYVVSEPVSLSTVAVARSRHHEFSGSPPFLDRDPLSLTSILRI
jgi:hypothetical protein